MKKVIMFSLLLEVTSNVFAIPTITKSISTGITFKFIETLSEKLPSGYKVKIDLNNGKGLVAMTCSGTTCTLSSNAFPKDVDYATYQVGIYDAKGILQGATTVGTFIIASTTIRLNEKTDIKRISAYEFAKIPLSELSLITKTQLQALSAEQIATLTQKNVMGIVFQLEVIDPVLISSFSKKVIPLLPVKDLTYKQIAAFTPEQVAVLIPKQLSTLTFEQVSAFTSKQIAALTTEQIAALIPVNTTPTKTSGYSKISNLGGILPDKAVLGTGLNDWACTKDNTTGLIWEVKTTDAGLRDWRYTYSWYEPDVKKNGGDAGYQDKGACKVSKCDTYAFTNAVNVKGLCGKKDWRMPTRDDFKGLFTTTLTVNNPSNEQLLIDATYFPNTPVTMFWSSLSSADYSYLAWQVYFKDGFSNGYYKDQGNSVRLVR
jgi:hypothetical protein